MDKNSNLEENIVIEFDSSNNGEVVIIRSDGTKWEARSGNLFASLSSIREKIEKIGLFPLCNGARIDINPSSMAQQAGASRKAYRLRLGAQATREDLLDIFAPTEKSSVSTLSDQKEYHRKWIASLG